MQIKISLKNCTSLYALAGFPFSGASDFTTPSERRLCLRQHEDDAVTLKSGLIGQRQLWDLLNTWVTCGTQSYFNMKEIC